MKEDIDKLIKSVFNKKLPPPQRVKEDGEGETTTHASFEKMLDHVKEEIPESLTGEDREDFVVLLHACGLLLGAFVCLDAAFDPAKRTTEEHHQGCLSSAERLAQEGSKTVGKLKKHLIKCSKPGPTGDVTIEIHRLNKKEE